MHEDAVAAPAKAHAMGRWARAAFTLLPLTALVVVAALLATRPLPLAGALAWVPALGVSFAWRIDGLSALMQLMVTGIGTAVFVYAGGYMAGHPAQRRLYVLLTLFMLAMIGCVSADDLFVLFLFWEATSVLSFMLVGFEHAREASRRAAQQALMVTGSGGLALLAGFILLAQAMGTSSISAIVAQLPAEPATPQLTAALLLILAGAFTKSAQVPFHFWLPNAMAAPTPVSAYLHSATMVKLGVYLLARLDPGFDHWPLWTLLLQAVGSVTAAWGMLLALRERDLKRILAWSTVATLGTLVLLVGLRGEGPALAVGALLLAHALYKAPLFFVAGNIDHGTGTRDIERLGNLRRAMPWTAAAALLAGMSMAGMPLSFGYVAKDAIALAKSSGEALDFARAAYAVFGAVAVAVAGVAAVRVFWRRPGVSETPEAHEGGWALVLPPLVLALLGIALGLFPLYAQALMHAAGVAMTPGSGPLGTDFAELVRPEAASFAVSLAIGAAVYLLWEPLHRVMDTVGAWLQRWSPAAHYERSLAAIPRLAAACTRRLQHGRLPGYMALAAGVAGVAVGAALLAGARDLPWPAWEAPPLPVLGGSLVVVAGALATLFVRDRLVLLLAAGLVGYGSAALFLFAGAPDVALTQFTVETVFVIVIAAVLGALAREGRARGVSEPLLRPGALGLALVLATALTGLLLAVHAGAFDTALTRFFAEASVSQAHGRNVVNVVLVDFRALDTLGEISVVLLSLLAAVPLLQAARRRAREARP
ncbi:hydrogen gas-evolving membrane-bound hydrogenase subunit E [Azohydromonas aeria]|uniref:hydrogen gas-evolving membrane-bound hydrogenase subunit E n=1 Tax=Azohydromonas aeria TaxID=2590212 RepID=UPI0012FA2EC9|nr:hydrogen gas-evolving membrane-bound hydrogenase subunit E [Azohydromonas aeria]